MRFCKNIAVAAPPSLARRENLLTTRFPAKAIVKEVQKWEL
jgi:hypothetical protein